MGTNELAFFTSSVNRLIEGKLILVDKHIATVLKCVAKSPTLCRTLSETVKTMSYATEFSRARITWTSVDGVVESKLKAPQDRNRLFAFVVCLLTEVDSGRRNILEFLREYYNAETADAGYARFANEILKPFKAAGESILRSIDPDSLDAEYLAQAQQYFSAEKIYVETGVMASVFTLMEEIRLILIDQNLSETAVAEAAAVGEFLVNAMYLKNPKILKVSWIAYKNTIKEFDAVADKLAEIASMMEKIVL
ncbi:MAG: hypothetical protein NC099_05415 [Corallococcus sp.]|nr:hypothetical protein [Corallococcus sp.]